jgi:hypothetical protein
MSNIQLRVAGHSQVVHTQDNVSYDSLFQRLINVNTKADRKRATVELKAMGYTPDDIQVARYCLAGHPPRTHPITHYFKQHVAHLLPSARHTPTPAPAPAPVQTERQRQTQRQKPRQPQAQTHTQAQTPGQRQALSLIVNNLENKTFLVIDVDGYRGNFKGSDSTLISDMADGVRPRELGWATSTGESGSIYFYDAIATHAEPLHLSNMTVAYAYRMHNLPLNPDEKTFHPHAAYPSYTFLQQLQSLIERLDVGAVFHKGGQEGKWVEQLSLNNNYTSSARHISCIDLNQHGCPKFELVLAGLSPDQITAKQSPCPFHNVYSKPRRSKMASAAAAAGPGGGMCTKRSRPRHQRRAKPIVTAKGVASNTSKSSSRSKKTCHCPRWECSVFCDWIHASIS